MSTYHLVFQNQSGRTDSVCVYQRMAGAAVGVFPLAWFAQRAAPTSAVYFDWTLDYAFVWAQTGMLVPGARFNEAQITPADLSTSNAITLASMDGAYRFGDQRPGPQPGNLYITQEEIAPANQISVGIGMSGRATFALQARSHTNAVFTSRQEYWIAFGDFQRGEVLDVETIQDKALVRFPPGVYSMTAIFERDGTWTIRETDPEERDLAPL